jgi:hypothetical protein
MNVGRSPLPVLYFVTIHDLIADLKHQIAEEEQTNVANPIVEVRKGSNDFGIEAITEIWVVLSEASNLRQRISQGCLAEVDYRQRLTRARVLEDNSNYLCPLFVNRIILVPIIGKQLWLLFLEEDPIHFVHRVAKEQATESADLIVSIVRLENGPPLTQKLADSSPFAVASFKEMLSNML